jgi:S-formylglutathione hydrolase FrmB
LKKTLFIPVLLLSISLFSQDLWVITASYVPYPDTVLVYKPSNYSQGKQYPLVILLHGWHQTYKYWNKVAGNLQNFADKYNFILACPDGFWDSWYIDSPVNPKSKVETFFINDLIPSLFKKYKVDMKNVFITGFSMGGHGSMYLFLKHQDIFKSAGSLSGTLDIAEFPNKSSMLNAFGRVEINPDNWNKNSVYNLLDNLKGKDTEIIFDCGTEDNLYFVSKKFYEKCLQLKIKATFISQLGLHRIEYWRKSFENHFRFFENLIDNK